LPNVLITGGTGFIGGALIQRLIDQDAHVTVLVREKPGQIRQLRFPDGVEVVEADLRYAAGLKRAVEAVAPEWVVHLAAVGVTNPFLPIGEALRSNLDGTINLLKAVSGQCRVLVARTPGEFEMINPYAASKAAAWGFCRMFHRTEGWPVVGVMPFQVYGPGQPTKTVLGAALKAAHAGEPFPMTSGEQKRDWVYIEDVVDGILAAATASGIDGETVELGTGLATSIKEVATRLFELAGKGQPLVGALPARPGEVPVMAADADRAEHLTGWRATIGIDEGLRRLIERG
jgi:nucleoside-diphosphate-sugar epimerase